MKNRAVLFETIFMDPADGWSIASRTNARAMAAAGLQLGLVSWTPWIGEPDPGVLREVGHLMSKPPSWDCYIHGTAFGPPERMQHPLSVLVYRAQGPRVVYTMLERSRISPASAGLLSQLEGVWVPSHASADTFIRSGVPRKKLFVIPLPFFPDDPHLGLVDLPRAPGPPRFYWIGRWEPRKAADQTVRAFLRAFKPGQATLTLKIGIYPLAAPGYPEGPEEVAIREIGSPGQAANNGWTFANFRSSIRVLRGKLPEEEMIRLHADHDVYVSASRGEGTDIPAFRAKLSGNRLVVTESGGPDEFRGDHDIVVPTSGEIDPHPIYGWEPGSKYVDYLLEDLIAGLQHAAGLVTQGDRQTKLDWPRDRFRAKDIGQKFAKMVEAVQPG